MRIVIALAECGSISEAAGQLNTSRSKLRRKLEAVEEATGAKLLARVGGVLTPTAQGRSFIEGAQRALHDASLLVAHTREIGIEPTGTLRLVLPPGFPFSLAMSAFNFRRERYKNLRQEIRVSEHPLELLPEEADVAIVVDEDLDLPGYSCTTLFSARYQLVASTEYLAEHGTPKHRDDLL